jgi:hypothetical protein
MPFVAPTSIQLCRRTDAIGRLADVTELSFGPAQMTRPGVYLPSGGERPSVRDSATSGNTKRLQRLRQRAKCERSLGLPAALLMRRAAAPVAAQAGRVAHN